MGERMNGWPTRFRQPSTHSAELSTVNATGAFQRPAADSKHSASVTLSRQKSLSGSSRPSSPDIPHSLITHVSPPKPKGRSISAAPTTSPLSPSPSRFSSNRRRSMPLQSSSPLGTSPGVGSLLGSYEASLFKGRMSNSPSNAAVPLPFVADIGVLGLGPNTPRGLKCPAHLHVPFGAFFWNEDGQIGRGSPYAATIDLEKHYLSEIGKAAGGEAKFPKFPGYRIPPKGQLQIVVRNQNEIAVSVFLVRYDVTDMPQGTKTFMRQKCYEVFSSDNKADGSAKGKEKEQLRGAVHLQFCSPPPRSSKPRRSSAPAHEAELMTSSLPSSHQHKPVFSSSLASSLSMSQSSATSPSSTPAKQPHVYLHRHIRIVFTSLAAESKDKIRTVYEGPEGLMDIDGTSKKSSVASAIERYTTYTGAGPLWEEALKDKKRRDLYADTGSSIYRTKSSQTPKIPEDPFDGSEPPSSMVEQEEWPSFDGLQLDEPFPVDPNGSYEANGLTPPTTLPSSSAIPPLVFTRQASPTPRAQTESGLSISRPGSRQDHNGTKSPEFVRPEALR